MYSKTRKRPSLLRAFCILTFVGSTLGFIGYFFAALFFEKTSEIIIEYSNWNNVDEISPLYFTTLMALMALSLTAAIRIWKLHRDGYYLYILSQLTIMFLPVFWINRTAFSDTNAIFTVIFFIGYGIHFKLLK
ncbi:MAG: hypothetical protein R2757_01825 [Draconibacterium sp.]